MYLTVANSYMDESFDPKHKGEYRGFFVVGGMLGRGWAVFELERRWERLLEKHGLSYFKASECENGWKQFSKFVSDCKNITTPERDILDSISLDFLRLIVNPVVLDQTHYLTYYGVGILQEDSYEAIKSDQCPRCFGRQPLPPSQRFSLYSGSMADEAIRRRLGSVFRL